MNHSKPAAGRPPLSGRRRTPGRKFILLLAALALSGAALPERILSETRRNPARTSVQSLTP